VKVIILRYAGDCGCGRHLPAGTKAGYDRISRAVICESCLVSRGLTSPAPTASSLERTYEKRKADREQRVTTRFPRAGRFLLAVTPEPASTRAFKTGAEGETKAAERILGRAGANALFLHNRRLGPGRRDGDIDLLAVTPRGVLVIDVKHYKDAKVEVRSSGGLFSARKQQLYVGGRDRTGWLESLDKQRDAVTHVLADSPGCSEVPVLLTFCFVDGDLPLLERLSIRDVSIYGSRQLGRRLRSATGPYDSARRAEIHQLLDQGLPPA
jgi:hypothetical protein